MFKKALDMTKDEDISSLLPALAKHFYVNESNVACT